MLTPEELRARRQAATREAKNSVPFFGILIGVIVFGSMCVFAFRKLYVEPQRGPGPVLLRYLAAMQNEDWAAAKSMSTPDSAPWLDATSRQFKITDYANKIDSFKKLTFFIDKVELLDTVAVVTVRKSKTESAARLDDSVFILTRAGDTWIVNQPLSNQKQQGQGGIFPD